MKKTLLTLSVLLASMLAVNAYAQKAAPGEDRAAPAASATKEEKAAAKDTRKTEGSKAAKSVEKGGLRSAFFIPRAAAPALAVAAVPRCGPGFPAP